MDNGILPLRRFSERSKISKLGIRSPIFDGIGPANELFFKYSSTEFLASQTGIGPLK